MQLLFTFPQQSKERVDALVRRLSALDQDQQKVLLQDTLDFMLQRMDESAKAK